MRQSTFRSKSMLIKRCVKNEPDNKSEILSTKTRGNGATNWHKAKLKNNFLVRELHGADRHCSEGSGTPENGLSNTYKTS